VVEDLVQQAKDLNGGKSRVELPDGRNVDLDSEPHFNKQIGEDVETPHTEIPRINESPTGPRWGYPNTPQSGNPWPANLKDLVDALTFLKGLQGAIGCLTGRKPNCHSLPLPPPPKMPGFNNSRPMA
jgi:hypothetical protein